MKLQVKVDGLQELQDKLKDFSQRRINAVIATALTRTAVQVRSKVLKDMDAMLDTPTPYTKRQLKYVAATAAKPVAAVGFGVVGISDERGNIIRYQDLGPGERPAGRYLQPQIEGGKRSNKAFELALQHVGAMPKGWVAVPGERAKINAYGNQSVGELKQILSWFDAATRNNGSYQNMGAKGREKRLKGTKKKAGFEYFHVAPGGMRSFTRTNGKTGLHKMQPGIYRRTTYALGSHIEPVVIFVKAANYKKRFDFYAIAESERDRLLPIEMEQAIDESAKRLAQRNG